jgi:hypothetical protein
VLGDNTLQRRLDALREEFAKARAQAWHVWAGLHVILLAWHVFASGERLLLLQRY